MKMKINILYEDSKILAVEKPQGVPAQPDKTGDLDMLTALEEEKGQKFGLVHRLDRPVGGVLLFAKDTKTEALLSKAMQAGKLKKTYLAVLCGEIAEKEGTWQDFLFKNGRTNLSEVVAKEKKGAKEAILHYRVLAEKDGLSLVQIQLQTGRHHQIRVQTSHHGVPIWGDRKYNVLRRTQRGEEIALWSYSMEGSYEKGKEFSAKSIPAHLPFSFFLEILEKM